MSAKNLLNSLAKGVKKPAAPKQDRPTVDVPDNVMQSFERLVGAKAVFEVAESRLEVESEVVKAEMLDLFAETLYKNGSVPANPKLQTSLLDGRPDMTGIFQVQNRFKWNIPEDVNGDTDIANRLQYALEAAGMPADDAETMIAAEIDCSPVVSMRPFGELVDGHYQGEGKNRTFIEATAEEKAVGQKLLEWVSGISAAPLTDDERAIVILNEERIKAKEGFLQRLKGYCNSEEILKGVLRVITPTHFVSHMKLGISDTPEQRQTRLKAIANEIIGVPYDGVGGKHDQQAARLKKAA